MIQLYLSLHDWRLVTDSNSTSQVNMARLYSSRAGWPVVTFFVLDKIDSSAYPTPLQMVQRFASLQTRYQGLLNNFDVTYAVAGSDVVLDPCSFVESPYVVQNNSNYQTIGLAASLVEDGFIFAIAILTSADPGRPFSFQIYTGTDKWNRPALPVGVEAFGKVPVNFTITPVAPNSAYDIYVVCSNNYPGYLQLANDSSIVAITWTTEVKPLPQAFSIEASLVICLIGIYFVM